jgi:hypothetical protein
MATWSVFKNDKKSGQRTIVYSRQSLKWSHSRSPRVSCDVFSGEEQECQEEVTIVLGTTTT